MRTSLFAVALTFCASACHAQAAKPVQVGIASFNMAWAGTEADFQAHVNVCNAAAWCDTRPKKKPGEATPSPAAIAAAKQCEATIEQHAGGAKQAMQIAPCNAYKTKDPAVAETAANYREKLAGLRATVTNLIENEGVQVLAFQEVKSDAAIRDALGKFEGTFEVCIAPHTAFQTVAFAWRKELSLRPGKCTPRTELAVKEAPMDSNNLRTVRPGLALELFVNDQTVTFMNVHLKSSCANLKPNGPFTGLLLTDQDEACRILNRQVPMLEDWIEAVDAKSPLFVLLGDFNRRIDEEADKVIPLSQVRSDGSDPSGPNTRDKLGYVASRYLWQEISDGKPTLYQVPLSSTDAACKGFTGLDHMVISSALKGLQDQTTFSSRKVPAVGKPGQKIETSDHCPRIMKLNL